MDAGGWLTRFLAKAPIQVHRVTGGSMLPTLAPGDLVVSRRAFGTPKAGRLVVVQDPEAPRRLIKRVVGREGAGFRVGSDAPAGARDSRAFGPLGRRHLVGVVTYVWRRPG